MGKKKNKVKKAIKQSKPNRNQVAVERKKEELVTQRQKINIVRKKDFIKNQFNGEYFLTRANMMADQLNSGEILETIDGCKKTEEFMRAEYALMRMQAIDSFRNAHFAKENLKEGGLTDEDIEAVKMSYYQGKVIQEDYNEEEKQKRKAEFVDSRKN